jgi:hypothetical protein
MKLPNFVLLAGSTGWVLANGLTVDRETLDTEPELRRTPGAAAAARHRPHLFPRTGCGSV